MVVTLGSIGSQAVPPVSAIQQASEVKREDGASVSQGKEISSPGEPLVSSDESSYERAPSSGIEEELRRNTGLRRILTLPSSMLTSTGDIANMGNSLDYLEGRTAELNSTINGLRTEGTSESGGVTDKGNNTSNNGETTGSSRDDQLIEMLIQMMQTMFLVFMQKMR